MQAVVKCLPVPCAASSHPQGARGQPRALEEEGRGKRLVWSHPLSFHRAGSHKSWTGFNPGLTAQPLWARSPVRMWPEELLALPSPKYSLEGFGHLGREDQSVCHGWAAALAAGSQPWFLQLRADFSHSFSQRNF